MRKLLFSILLVSPLFTWGQSNNDPIDLEQILIEGNRLQVPFSWEARDIQLLTRKEIDNLPVKSINEILAYVGGVDIRQRGPFGTQADIAVDGGSSEQTLLLINGIKVPDAQTAHNMLILPISLDAIDHIEIVRGPAARRYGTNALTGAVNIVTKKSKHSFLTVDLQGGSSFKQKEEEDGSGIYGGGEVSLTGNIGSEKQSHLFSISQNDYNGQRYNSASNNTRLFYNGNYEVNNRNSLYAMAGYVMSRFGANGFYAAPGDRNSEEIVKNSFFSLSSKHQWGNFTLSPRISDRYGEDDYRYFKDDLDNARSKHYTNALMLEVNAGLHTTVGTFGLGWESRLEKINSSNIGQHERDNHGAYAEWRNRFGKIESTAGFYANYNTVFGWQVFPGLDLAYFINEHWKISASLGTGERIPSFSDLYLNQLPGNVGNENVTPENARNYEGNLQYRNGNLLLQSGYFLRTITDFIDWVRPDADHPYSPINYGKNKMQGFYARIGQHFTLNKNQRLGYRISYNYLRPTVRFTEGQQSKYVLESLRHQFILGFNYQFRQFSLQVQNRLLRRELASAYDVVDIRINYNPQPFQLYAELTNLFNTQYTEAGAVPMPTRWFSLGVKYSFEKK